MKESNKSISIIVPVYNVYDWLDECMESIVNQTYGDFEIILINDGSTDGSDKKCIEWAEKDSRIRYIDKENEGVFIARNLGLKEAHGEYVIFIDSDDWLDLTYVEKMYNKAKETGADIIECDFWRYNNITGSKTYRPCYGRMEKEYTLEEHMIYGESTLWKYMSKKSIWLENNIVIPNCLGSAQVVYVLLLALGAKIVNIHEPLYYYRRLRKGSILDINGKNTAEEGKMGLQQLSVFIEEFKKRNLYDKYEDVIEKTVKYRLSDFLAAQFTRKNKDEFKQQSANYYKFIDDYFPEKRNNKYFNIGGYNLNRILSYLTEIQNPSYRFNFSSIISIMHPSPNVKIRAHSNKYRNLMIQRDIESSFWKLLITEKPKYIFIDFLEERFDVLKLKNGGIITASDAFEELNESWIVKEILTRDSEEGQRQWEEDCTTFFDKIIDFVEAKNIILVENYLSEEVGDINSKRKFENLEYIRKTNNLLRNYYNYFKQNCKGIRCIEAYKCNNYFTDEKYEYGAIPSHLNEVVNKEIAEKIMKALE